MSVLERPNGDEVAAIYGPYMGMRQAAKLRRGDKVDILCTDGLNYHVEIKEMGDNGRVHLHFLFWSAKHDYRGSVHKLYIATLGLYSAGILKNNTYSMPSIEPLEEDVTNNNGKPPSKRLKTSSESSKQHAQHRDKETYAAQTKYPDDFFTKPRPNINRPSNGSDEGGSKGGRRTRANPMSPPDFKRSVSSEVEAQGNLPVLIEGLSNSQTHSMHSLRFGSTSTSGSAVLDYVSTAEDFDFERMPGAVVKGSSSHHHGNESTLTVGTQNGVRAGEGPSGALAAMAAPTQAQAQAQAQGISKAFLQSAGLPPASPSLSLYDLQKQNYQEALKKPVSAQGNSQANGSMDSNHYRQMFRSALGANLRGVGVEHALSILRSHPTIATHLGGTCDSSSTEKRQSTTTTTSYTTATSSSSSQNGTHANGHANGASRKRKITLSFEQWEQLLLAKMHIDNVLKRILEE
jgi:hypothetical protein